MTQTVIGATDYLHSKNNLQSFDVLTFLTPTIYHHDFTGTNIKEDSPDPICVCMRAKLSSPRPESALLIADHIDAQRTLRIGALDWRRTGFVTILGGWSKHMLRVSQTIIVITNMTACLTLLKWQLPTKHRLHQLAGHFKMILHPGQIVRTQK